MQRLRFNLLVRQMRRDTLAEMASPYLTTVEVIALDQRDAGHALDRIGRSLGLTEDVAAELVASARRKRAAGVPVGAASPRRSGRMMRNHAHWLRGIRAELERRGEPWPAASGKSFTE
jgi:hypothetical protein